MDTVKAALEFGGVGGMIICIGAADTGVGTNDDFFTAVEEETGVNEVKEDEVYPSSNKRLKNDALPRRGVGETISTASLPLSRAES